MNHRHISPGSSPDYRRLRQVLDTVPFERVIDWVFDAPEPRSHQARGLWHSLYAKWKQFLNR